tara:strand:+ start:4210 stop:4770 length:561 start_codon:yes stop_codon:yes gene_type:complete
MSEKLVDILEFLKNAEKLKDTLRSGYTSSGKQESVAEHTWRLCLMAILFHGQYYPHLDLAKLLKMCLIHDLGEALNGDIPAPEQEGKPSKTVDERADLMEVISPLPNSLQKEIMDLWEDYESASSDEAKLAKALDKLETLIQHNQGKNPHGFDYAFNLEYGKQYTSFDEIMARLRELIDEETRGKV